jgi:hydrogenase expression/formation protein HypC
MCLAIPGQVIEIESSVQPATDDLKMGTVSFGGIHKRVCLEWIPDVQVGEYVIVHVGFAISKIDQEEALETLKLFQEMDSALDELKTDDPAGIRPQ